MSDDAQWLREWPPFRVARLESPGPGQTSAFRRLWLSPDGSSGAVGFGIDTKRLELWLDPAMVVAVGVHERIGVTQYGVAGGVAHEISRVYIGRLNPTSFTVLGSPLQVFSLLELVPT